MKAVCLVDVGAPLEERELPEPSVTDGDVVVRVSSAGICHSDAHYRAGTAGVSFLPVALGHEVAGVVVEAGSAVPDTMVGRRVALHYLVGCGRCEHCRAGREAFCAEGQMLGKHRHGGYAEHVVVPARNAVPVPDSVPDDVAAVMMCSTVTALHALRKARFKPGETVAVFGCGGLGMSAVLLASALGASAVFAVDVSSTKLDRAVAAGAHPINANEQDAANAILAATGRRGVDVALEFAGLPTTVDGSIRAAGVGGRAAMVALMDVPAPVYTYRDLIAREVEVIGVSDHLRQDAEDALAMAGSGLLRLSSAITRRVRLDADSINAALDGLETGTTDTRVVIEA